MAEALTTLGLLECMERHKLLGPEKYYREEMGRKDLAVLLAPPEDIHVKSAPASVKAASCLSLSHIMTIYTRNKASCNNVTL